MRSNCHLILLPLLLAACDATGDAPKPQDSADTKSEYAFVLGPSDANRAIRIRSGRRFGIRLTDNSSVGDEWRVTEVPPNIRSEGFLYEGEPAAAEGADTTKIFRFVGTRAGHGPLRLVLEYRGEHRRNLEFEVITE